MTTGVQLERPPKKPRKVGTVKRANHSVCFITAQLLAGTNEKWPCIHLYQISLFSVKQSEIWVRDYFPTARDEALREPAWEANFEEVH